MKIAPVKIAPVKIVPVKIAPTIFAKLTVMMTLASVATAHEFRVETEVYRIGEDRPVSTSLTLCESGLIYDFILSQDEDQFADEIAIFDTRERKFVLIDLKRKIKTTVYEHHISRLLSALKSKGVLKQDFLIDPEFTEDFDLSTGWLKLSSPQLTYRARGQAVEDGSKMPVYFEYLDQFARLKATDARGMPPFPRMKLNTTIKKYNFIPNEIHLSLEVNDAGQQPIQIKMKSQHHVLWQLSKQDREQIEMAKKHWMTFEEVELREYRGMEFNVSNN